MSLSRYRRTDPFFDVDPFDLALAPVRDLSRWMDPFSDSGLLTNWPNMDMGRRTIGDVTFPSLDVQDVGNHLEVNVELPGIPRENVKLEITDDNRLSISGKHILLLKNLESK